MSSEVGRGGFISSNFAAQDRMGQQFLHVHLKKLTFEKGSSV